VSDKFKDAMEQSGLGEKYAASSYAEYGAFTDDTVQMILLARFWINRQLPNADPASSELISVTWMNESSFRCCPPPNKNQSADDFDGWDLGPMQMNKRVTQADWNVKFYRPIPLYTPAEIFGLPTDVFTGNPFANILQACVKLGRIHGTDEDKAGIYTGGDRVKSRRESFREWAPFFREFFRLYSTVPEGV
jgi:hypothetical protein